MTVQWEMVWKMTRYDVARAVIMALVLKVSVATTRATGYPPSWSICSLHDSAKIYRSRFRYRLSLMAS